MARAPRKKLRLTTDMKRDLAEHAAKVGTTSSAIVADVVQKYGAGMVDPDFKPDVLNAEVFFISPPNIEDAFDRAEQEGVPLETVIRARVLEVIRG